MNYSDFVIRSCRKTPNTLSEAFRDAEYCSAITYPKESDYSAIGAFLGALFFVGVFGYCLWRTI